LETTTSSRAVRPAAVRLGAGALTWQRTDTIGTELVFQLGSVPGAASGTSVVAGSRPFTTRWRSELRADWTVSALTAECEGDGWWRSIELTRDSGDAWSCRTEQRGDLDAPPPGVADASLIGRVVRLADSPIFLTWAVRALDVRLEGPAVAAPTARILPRSLAVVLGESRYQRVGGLRLRVTGEEPAVSYDVDEAGVVLYQPGRLRITR
jgi:hypothetical protein